MDRHTQLEARVREWTAAGVIDAATGGRIITFEAGQERQKSLRWPILLAMIFGGILVAAGVTLFVAAHWDELSPTFRFSLLLAMVAAFHIGGSFAAEGFPALSTTLHAIGTVTLGAAIFLTAQIFNLHENWATGILLWAIGAAVGYILLRDWAQAAAVALLVPTWLISQWSITTAWQIGSQRPLAVGLILIALAYLSARVGDETNTVRRTLTWIGGLALLPCVLAAVILGARANLTFYGWGPPPPVTFELSVIGWTVALLAPLALAWLLRRELAWVNAAFAVWAFVLVLSAASMHQFGETVHTNAPMVAIFYLLCAVGAVGLVVWGLREKRKERLNVGIAGFAITVLFFYFDNFMGKIGRSASLLLLGLICLAGGYALEMTRRKLVRRMESHA